MTWDQWILLGAVILWALFLWVSLISNIVFRWKSYSVVRCRDCVYKECAAVNEKGYLICPASGMEITDRDYCSYGERRDDCE